MASCFSTAPFSVAYRNCFGICVAIILVAMEYSMAKKITCFGEQCNMWKVFLLFEGSVRSWSGGVFSLGSVHVTRPTLFECFSFSHVAQELYYHQMISGVELHYQL